MRPGSNKSMNDKWEHDTETLPTRKNWIMWCPGRNLITYGVRGQSTRLQRMPPGEDASGR
jgi:hypothetical protein